MFAIYDTGGNYLLVELAKHGLRRGLSVDTGWGNLWVDLDSFDDEDTRLGAVKLDEGGCAKMMRGARYVGKSDGFEMTEFMSNFEFDGEWSRYASQ